MIEQSNPFNLIGQLRVNLYSFIHMLRHDPNPIRDIIACNFLHNLRTRPEPNTKLEG
jgi:hypothetical protein